MSCRPSSPSRSSSTWKRPRWARTEPVLIGIVVKPGSLESTRTGFELKVALDRTAGAPHQQAIVDWRGARDLVDEVQRRRFVALYFAPGLEGEIAATARAFEGQGVLTIGAVDSYVREGAILGFELISGRPKWAFNLTQARSRAWSCGRRS